MTRTRALAVALAVVVSTCSSDGGSATTTGGPDDLDLRRVADTVIVPRYERFAGASADLTLAISQLCAEPTPAALEAARNQWQQTRAAWRHTAAFGFGPAMELRTKSAVDFPTSAEKVAEVVAGAEPVTVDAVADLGSSARGLGTIEELLYGADSDALAGPSGARSCDYAAAASELVEDAAAEVAAAWTSSSDPYRDTFAADELMALNDVFNQSVATLQGLADKRLATAVGEATGTPNPEASDPGPAQRALDDMVDDLDGVTAAYESVLGPATTRQSDEAAERLGQQLRTGQQALVALPRPLTAAVTSDAAGARAALTALQEAKRTLATEVASLLGLTLTFSEADGDS
ncbi:MAG TPA: imelysin family protein [Acidimicrobiales bacterium]|nr:imelysin family protein [Acidimicrobiales bacterium]